MRINEVDKPVTQADIDQLERFADKLFAKVGIDVEFTRHFLDRVNDERNMKQITMSELTRLFKQEYKRWAKPIAQLGPDAEAVMKDMATDINLPFALRWDHQNKELDLIAKTVMRKPDFKTSNPEFAVEDVKQSGALKVINNLAARSGNEAFPIKFDSGKLIYVKPITARKILRLFDIAPKNTIDKFMTYINTANGFRELAHYANRSIKGTVKEDPNEGLKSIFKPNAYAAAAARLHSVLQRKKKENDAEGKPFRHALGWYAARIASGYRANIDSRELVAYYQDNYDAVLSEADLSYAPTMLVEQALPNMWPSNPQQFQSKLGTLPNTANQVRGNIIELFPEQFKNNPRVRVSVGNYLVKNPAIFQELVAANDNNASRFRLPSWVKKGAPFAKVFGGILTGILWPTAAGDPNEAQHVIVYNMIDSIIRTDPSSAIEDIKEWYKDQGNPNDYVNDWYYQNAVRHHNDQIVNSLDGVVDPGLQKAANELADRMRKAENQKELNDLIGTIDGPLQKAIDNIAPNVTTEIPPEVLLNPKTNSNNVGLNPPPEFNDPTEIFDIPPITAPEPEIKPNPANEPDDGDLPKKDDGHGQETPVELPGGDDGQQTKFPQPNNPQGTPSITTLPPLAVQLPNQEIAWSNDNATDTATRTSTSTDGTDSGDGKGNNKNRKKKDDFTPYGDSDYNDPLQRWQQKYGTWEPRQR